MAKVKITGHASGTGVVTVTAPNTSTDRTITLPDATGTLLNSDGSGANLTSLPADATKLPLAGGTMTGVLNMGTADTVSTNNKIIFGKAVTASQSYLPVIQQGSPDGAGVDLILATTSGTGAVRVFTGNSGTSGVPFANSNTEKLSILSDGRGLSSFTAKAWCKMEGTGTPSFFGTPHNCSSITDNGTGHYTLNLTNAMANSNGSAVGNCVAATSGSDNRLACCTVTGTSTIDVRTGNASNGTYVDVAVANIIVFGD